MPNFNPPRRNDRGVPALHGLHRGGLGRPALPPGFRYVLMLRADEEGSPRKPIAFHDLGAMARHIHHARRPDRGLQLTDAPMSLTGHDDAQPGVSVWILDPASGDRRTFLGWAYVNGASRWTLQAALEAEQPGPVH